MTQHLQHEGREIIYCAPSPDLPAKPPILFVHGAFAGAWMWESAVAEFAAAGHPCAAVSLRGHGNSEGHDRLDWFGIHDYVDDMEVAADWLGATPILVGHSMGGYVAQKFLTRRPALGLALLCSVPPQGLLASQINLMFSRPNLFIEMNQMMDGKIPNAKVVRDALFAGEISDEVVNQFLSTTQRESQRAIWDMSMVSLFGHGIRELPPMLIIGAEKDVLIPPFLVQATARAFGVEATIYPGMGHAITHEKAWPDVSTKLIQWAETL